MSPLRAESVCRRLCAATVITLVIIGASTNLAVAGANGTVDQPVDAGSVVITMPDNPARPIVSGDSNSVFSLTIPDGASCPGDTFYDDWRVQSFIIPAADDPGALRYGIIWPEGDGLRSLYSAATMPYSQIVTGRGDGAGQPGPVVQPGPMTFSIYEAGLFPAGRYRIGLACTKYRETAAYWDTEIVIEDDSEVQPGGFTWSVADNPADGAPAPAGSGGSNAWVIAVAGVAIVGGVLFVGRNRRSSRTNLKPQEQT